MFLKQDMTPFEEYLYYSKYLCSKTYILYPFLTLKNRLFKHAVVPISFKKHFINLTPSIFCWKTPNIFEKRKWKKRKEKFIFVTKV